MRERMDAVLASLQPDLSPDQLEALAAWREQQAQTRMVQVHVPAGTTAEARRVRVGIGDAQYTELVDGPLQEGDRVVIGYAAPPR
jgi:hypothetical protein